MLRVHHQPQQIPPLQLLQVRVVLHHQRHPIRLPLPLPARVAQCRPLQRLQAKVVQQLPLVQRVHRRLPRVCPAGLTMAGR